MSNKVEDADGIEALRLAAADFLKGWDLAPETRQEVERQLVGWTTQVDVVISGGVVPKRDLQLEILSDCDVLSRVSLNDLIRSDLDLLDEDADPRGFDTPGDAERASKKGFRRGVVAALRNLADDIERAA